jgi:hypothetical protein
MKTNIGNETEDYLTRDYTNCAYKLGLGARFPRSQHNYDPTREGKRQKIHYQKCQGYESIATATIKSIAKLQD